MPLVFSYSLGLNTKIQTGNTPSNLTSDQIEFFTQALATEVADGQCNRFNLLVEPVDNSTISLTSLGFTNLRFMLVKAAQLTEVTLNSRVYRGKLILVDLGDQPEEITSTLILNNLGSLASATTVVIVGN